MGCIECAFGIDAAGAVLFSGTAASWHHDAAIAEAVDISLGQLSSLRLGFAKGASVPIAVVITGMAKAVRANRAAVTAGVGRGMSIGALSVQRAWLPAPKASSAGTEFHSACDWQAGRRPGSARCDVGRQADYLRQHTPDFDRFHSLLGLLPKSRVGAMIRT